MIQLTVRSLGKILWWYCNDRYYTNRLSARGPGEYTEVKRVIWLEGHNQGMRVQLLSRVENDDVLDLGNVKVPNWGTLSVIFPFST